MGKKSSTPKQDAVYLGMQQTQSGDTYPLYNITADSHPLYGSTVSEKTLQNLNLRIPDRPHGDSDGNAFNNEGSEKNVFK